MLTHEKVLKVFGPYLDADPDYEVVKTSRGYTLLAWNNLREEWFSAEFCKTPEDLRDALLDAYVNYLEYVVTDEDRDPTKQEMQEIQKKRQAMYYIDINLNGFHYKGNGQVYFATIYSFGEIPPYSEMGEIGFFDALPDNLTYPILKEYFSIAEKKLHEKQENELFLKERGYLQ